ncbi:MAG: hypothetical protein ACUVTH_11790 [Thermogutta sp.]
MNDSSMNHDQLAQALKEAAKAERPVFSETLYAQIIERASALRSVQPQRSNSASRRLMMTLKRVGWLALASYATLVTVAVLAQFFQKYQAFYGKHSQISGTNAIDSSQQAEEKRDVIIGPKELVTTMPTEPIENLVSAPDRTVRHMEFALSQIDRQRWASLDHDLRLAQQLLQNQLPLGVLSRAETGDGNTP